MNQPNAVAASGSIWAYVPALLLGSMLLGLGTLAYIAIDDPHFALEPNYYDKAVHWDRARAEARASNELGLRLSLRRTLEMAPDGKVDVELEIVDRAGAPFSAAEVQLEALPNAYANRVQDTRLRETSPGVYRGNLIRGTLGLWQLRFRVSRGTARFSQILRADVSSGAAS